MKSAIMAKPVVCEEESDNLEEKYQEQLRENDCMRREIRRKGLEISNLKERCETLRNMLISDRKLFETERKEWGSFKDDLLLVVRAADDYKTEAIKSVEKYKTENSLLAKKVDELEKQLIGKGDKITNHVTTEKIL